MEIVHRPYGQEHPYEQGPEERFPREPLAGDPFTVGISIRPPGAAEQVTVHTAVDGVPGPSVEALQVRDWEPRLAEGVGADLLERLVKVDQDIWEADLVAPEAGQTLTYWIEADGKQTPSFMLRGAIWRADPAAIAALDGSADKGWVLTIAPGQDGSRPALPGGLPHLDKVEWLDDGARMRRVRLTFACGADERFFGLGERFNALDQRGNVMDIRVYEQYKSQGKRAYLPVPFLLSSRGYGLYVDSKRWMQFDLAASDPGRWTLEADLGPDHSLALHWFNGADPLVIVGQFARFSGPPALPPAWSFGLWMSSNEWNSQARVEREVEQSLALGIDPAVVVIEAWSDESTFYIWNDARYTPIGGDRAFRYADFTFPPEGLWPDPKGMIDRLHARDIRLVLWQIPAMKPLQEPHPQHEADRAYFEQAGLGVKAEDGSLYRIRPFWFQNGYLWDVTNPAARDWWFNKRAYLVDELGVDGFKTDGGEHLWGQDMRFADGRRGDELWNEYPKRYTQAYHEFVNARRGGSGVTFSRAGFTGSQVSPIHWAGDEASTWEAFRASILAGLSAGISGIPFWSWDIAGFSGDVPTAELYLRGTAMAAFCPIMQYHSEYNPNRAINRDRTPWNIQARTGDDRVVPLFRYFLYARHNLMPYIWQEARHSAASGEPMMRALALTEPQASPYQYTFGRDLLVCPVVEPGAQSWPVYLPEGQWTSLWTRERFTGGRVIEVPAPLDTLPVFVRQGAEVPAHLPRGGQLGSRVPFSIQPNSILSF